MPRLVSIGLVPLTVAPFAAGSLNPILDATLAATILIHSYIGFQCAKYLGEPAQENLLTEHIDRSSLTTFPRNGSPRHELCSGGVYEQPQLWSVSASTSFRRMMWG